MTSPALSFFPGQDSANHDLRPSTLRIVSRTSQLPQPQASPELARAQSQPNHHANTCFFPVPVPSHSPEKSTKDKTRWAKKRPPTAPRPPSTTPEPSRCRTPTTMRPTKTPPPTVLRPPRTTPAPARCRTLTTMRPTKTSPPTVPRPPRTTPAPARCMTPTTMRTTKTPPPTRAP
ncbi:hypothetical protein BT67DRAFT_119358 [Trichocladium antarcticum]|uniref:Uncharacterized protein n=1 Tax=Trichocladium antarcticum TaxID=1450529 RepID=A0AAN6ZHG8_9PEZI|nr:hypothetical protein BT67DRAFT_119358 [Trichocladium antarcticum]